MKKILIIGITIGSLLAFSSCKKMLDVEVRSSITGEVYWAQESDFQTYLAGIYARYRTHIDYMGFGEDRGEMWEQGVNARFTPYYFQNITAGNTQQWTAHYGTIGHVNLLLEKIESWNFVNQATKDQIKAEAYAMRAAMYFFVSRVWGDVPIITASVKDEKESLYPRSSAADAFVQINEDIQKALSLFPAEGFNNKYKWSKPSVYALLADVKMWSASVLNGGNSDFLAAIDAINKVEASGVQLLDNFGSIIDVSRNNEIIFSIYLDRAEYVSAQYNYAFGGSALADNAADLPISREAQSGYCVGPRVLELFSEYPQDIRIKRTFVPEVIAGDTIRFWPYKFIGTVYPDTRIADSDIILYRLADMLLLKAEAYAAMGDADNALLYLNKVRTRAQIPDYTETDVALLQKEILDERGRELFHEIKRWYDLRRAHALGVIDVYQFVPNLVGKSTPLYWAVHVNMLSRNNLLQQTTGY